MINVQADVSNKVLLDLQSKLTPFLDDLPIPKTIAKLATDSNDEDSYEVNISSFLHSFHKSMDRSPLEVWGYNKQYPGPVIEAVRDRAVQVIWKNQLPPAIAGFPFAISVDKGTTFIAAPSTPPSHGDHAQPKAGHTTVHLHGAKVPAASDGWPLSFIHPEGTTHGSTAATFRYPNHQPGALLWYHDHTMATTRLGVYAGLAGMYMLRDADEAALGLPSGDYEIPLIIQDRMFKQDAQSHQVELVYQVDQTDQPEFFGDYIVVNGKVWPKLDVEPRMYRFRVVNGSNSRFYGLTLQAAIAAKTPLPKVYQIGADGGFLPAPVILSAPLLIAPGERADLVIDFTDCSGEFIWRNTAPAPFQNIKLDAPPSPGTQLGTAATVMKFVVGSPKPTYQSPTTTSLPTTLPIDFTHQIGDQQIDLHQDLGKIEADWEQHYGQKLRQRLDLTLTEDEQTKLVLLGGKHFDRDVSEVAELGAIEIWELDNQTGDTHPIHLHLVQFLILERRRKIDQSKWPIDPNERGWKDTVRCNPGEITKILVRFPDRSDAEQGEDYSGWYVWHCHMLEHEDHDMMRPLYVVPVRPGDSHPVMGSSTSEHPH